MWERDGLNTYPRDKLSRFLIHLFKSLDSVADGSLAFFQDRGFTWSLK